MRVIFKVVRESKNTGGYLEPRGAFLNLIGIWVSKKIILEWK